jgi:hypothetical protein
MDDTLANRFVYEFSTATIGVTKLYPSSGFQGLNPLMIACFDQKIDAQEIAKVTKCFVHGPLGIKKMHSGITVVSKEEASAASGTIKLLIQHEKEGYYVVFYAARPFPYDSLITVQVGPGVPSAEGPLLADMPFTASFTTIPPFGVNCTLFYILLSDTFQLRTFPTDL